MLLRHMQPAARPPSGGAAQPGSPAKTEARQQQVGGGTPSTGGTYVGYPPGSAPSDLVSYIHYRRGTLDGNSPSTTTPSPAPAASYISSPQQLYTGTGGPVIVQSHPSGSGGTSSGSVLRCAHCGKVFASQEVLTTHERDVHGLHKCGRCSTVFGVQEMLTAHQRDAHGIYKKTEKQSTLVGNSGPPLQSSPWRSSYIPPARGSLVISKNEVTR